MGDLCGGVLKESLVLVETETGCAAEPSLLWLAIAEQKAVLVIVALRRIGVALVRIRYAQKCVPAADSERAVMVVYEGGAGIDSTGFEVVVEVPFGIGALTRLNPQAGNDWGEAAHIIQKCNPGEISSRRKDIA